ncbi:MAG: dTDP-4-amino-4,6-dideoxygalactose transaminase [Clostridia bacterium]|nr:dTDP-4-amino-4,6-dideoxygalactose transaminase [Deltaproteobacteria bacterium]
MTAPYDGIDFHKPTRTSKDAEYMLQALNANRVSGGGPFTGRAEKLLKAIIGAQRVLLATSCTHALEMAALLYDIKPGDEVILPSFTFTSTANAFVLRGAKIVFADSRPDTLNMDERGLEALITKRTRAIVPVHYAGIACEMDTINAIAKSAGAEVLEDNAHGLFGFYKGKPLGSLGGMATQSFHESKNITCGEGGALVFNDARYLARAEILREKGTNRSAFFRGEVDKYTWVDMGSSYVISDVLAAYLTAQLEEASVAQAHRRKAFEAYIAELAPVAAKHGVKLPTVPAECTPAYHLFYMLMPTAEHRDALIKYLREQKIWSVFHYVPLHSAPEGVKVGGKLGDCPVVEDIANRLIRLPFHSTFAEADQARVIECVTEYCATKV